MSEPQLSSRNLYGSSSSNPPENENDSEGSQNSRKECIKSILRQRVMRIILILLFFLFGLLTYEIFRPQTALVFEGQPIPEVAALGGDGQFRRILWLQTDQELEGKHVDEVLVAQNLIHFAKQASYQVRIVNNLNAYDWLPEETTTLLKEIHQKSKFNIPISELLRLSLLYEHGGVSIRLPNVLLIENLEWVEDFLQESKIDEASQQHLSCELQGAKVIMSHESKNDGTIWYRDQFIAAKPKSHLFKSLLSEIASISKNGVWPYPDYDFIINKDEDTLVISLYSLIGTLVNVFHGINQDLCQKYGLRSFPDNGTIYMANIADDQASQIINTNQRAYTDANGKKYMLRINFEKISDDIINIVRTGDLSSGDGNSLLKNKLIMVEGNIWVATPSKKIRDVHFCIVSLNPQRLEEYQKQIKEQLDRFAKQTFTHWNLVNFVDKLPAVSTKAGEKVTLVNASEYEGLNLQRAATKYCDPASVILLLDHDETLTSQKDLEKLAGDFKNVGVFAAFINLKTTKKEYTPTNATRGEVRRIINKPNEDVLNEIRNLMRVFTVQSYRFIAQFDLYHSSTGRYFDREIPLLAVLEISEHFTPCDKGFIAFQVRRLEKIMDMPRQKVFTSITINSNRMSKIDVSRFEYFAKFRQRHLCGTIKYYMQLLVPVELLGVLNDGREEQGLVARKGLPELIPRKIHQIWIKGAIPAFKQFLIKRLRDAHPDYEYFLWSKENFTRENFPQSYDLLQNLLEMDVKSPYSKMAMVADIARNEIMFHNGGFYVDTNFMFFHDRALDQFLTYTFASVAELSPRPRAYRNNAFFGATRHNPRLERIISHRILSTRNHFSKNAAKETGPGLFGRVQRGNEEMDKDAYQSALQELSPNFIYDSPNYNLNKCETPNTTPDTEILFRSPKRSYLKNCSEIYDYAMGLDFWEEGFTWAYRRW